jgi:hypothetical protein
MSLQNPIEPQMNTDETQINNFSGNCSHIIQVILNHRVTHGCISVPKGYKNLFKVNPCSSVASKGS